VGTIVATSCAATGRACTHARAKAGGLPGHLGYSAVPPRSDDIVHVLVPLAIRKRGGRKLLLVPGGTDPVPDRPRVDNAMIKALARAFRWRKLMLTGAFGTIDEIATALLRSPSIED